MLQKLCSNCGSKKEDSAQEYCDECGKEYSNYNMVKEFIRNNPNTNAIEVANETGLDLSKIMKFLKGGLFS
ncbi:MULTISPECIES: hypothetical protein [Bacillaceae]|uniref:Zinc ribbon domain-containing protein n=1 Tax=Evansella alkalicola TaxID=745819 RepID=A0ABS6JUN5_9BACI|nr:MULTISPECIES: hypothetical protein [Bacillaceae]MBU9722285.1 hypothetical protein [Bacillus alkalicola]